MDWIVKGGRYAIWGLALVGAIFMSLFLGLVGVMVVAFLALPVAGVYEMLYTMYQKSKQEA